MRIGYADPPYPGCAHLYRGHPDYAGEVDHVALVDRLDAEFDGWVLHTSTSGYRDVLAPLVVGRKDVRICAWLKSFASFKPGVRPAYAWEPVLVRAVRKPDLREGVVIRDFVETEETEPAIKCPITLRKGLAGAKPPKVIRWSFALVGAKPQDDLVDLFPGTGIVGREWNEFRAEGSGDA